MGNRVEKVQAMIDAFVQSALMLLLGFAMLRGAAIGGLSLVSQRVVVSGLYGAGALRRRLPVSALRPIPSSFPS